MPFVNEYISAEDAVRHHLSDIDETLRGGGISDQWTIDHDRGIYLRVVARGHEEENRHETLWSFYWRGHPHVLQLDLHDAGGKRGGAAWSHWRLIRVNGSHGLPQTFKSDRHAFTEDLKLALTTYKDAGVLSRSTDFTLIFDISDECVL